MADDIEKFGRDLDKLISPKVWGKHMQRRHTPTLTKAVTASAKAGIGPQNVPYPAYEESYQKVIAKHGGQKQWLVGLGGPPHMLDGKRFSIEVSPDGRRISFVWTATGEKMGIYAHVHNDGLPIGRGGPRKQREFMHFENVLNETALTKAAEASFDALAAQFAAGRTPK